MTSIRRASAVLACLVAAGLARAAEIKVGSFDFQRVSEETARGQELQASLAKFRDKKQEEIGAKENELKSLRDQYNAQALSLSPDRRSQMEKEIQKKELELQGFREGAQREMQIEVNEAQQKFQEQLFGVITSLGKERGYTVIFEKSQAVFFSAGADMTSEVIEKFNQETAPKPGAVPAAGSSPPPPKAPEEKKPPAPTKPPQGGAGESKPPAHSPAGDR